jgi:hypothetical protein
MEPARQQHGGLARGGDQLQREGVGVTPCGHRCPAPQKRSTTTRAHAAPRAAAAARAHIGLAASRPRTSPGGGGSSSSSSSRAGAAGAPDMGRRSLGARWRTVVGAAPAPGRAAVARPEALRPPAGPLDVQLPLLERPPSLPVVALPAPPLGAAPHPPADTERSVSGDWEPPSELSSSDSPYRLTAAPVLRRARAAERPVAPHLEHVAPLCVRCGEAQHVRPVVFVLVGANGVPAASLGRRGRSNRFEGSLAAQLTTGASSVQCRSTH